MAVTGTGTQNDPWVVHSYDEFISKSGVYPTGSNKAYIKFFDEPNQTINCNNYGSEFKWDTFEASVPSGIDYYVDIDLNGTIIKNLMVKAGVPMFKASYHSWSAGGAYYSTYAHLTIHDGSIRNVFLGGATSRIAVADGGELKIDNASFSVNSTTATTEIFNGVKFDNCALYMAQATLASSLMQGCTVTDTDFELHINNLNEISPTANSSFTDCRFQGKFAGKVAWNYPTNFVFHNSSTFTNCVVDIDLTETNVHNWNGAEYLIIHPNTLNTNILCNSHYPLNPIVELNFPTDWNYMPHEGNDGKNIRNGAYLNSKGFVVVQVS